MSSELKNIVIIGGGGDIGAIVLRALVGADLNITALKRPGSKSQFPTASNLKVVESDGSEGSLLSAFKDQDAVISVVGATGFQTQFAQVDAAVKSGVKRFFPSEFGINTQSKAVQEMTKPFFGVKQELIDYLRSKEKDGLSWTGFIVGMLFDWSLANGFLGFDFKNHKADIWDDGNTILSGITERDLEKAIISCLAHPAETANKFVYVSSIETSHAALLAAAEKATSTQWDVTRRSTADRLAEAHQALSKGDFSGAFTIVKACFWGALPGLGQNFEQDESDRLANDLLGIRKVDVQQMVEKVVAEENFSGKYV